MSTKTCSKCGVEKDVGEFGKNKSRKDGLQERCKSCRKEHYEANHEEILAKNKEHYEANREEKLAKNKEHYEANREEILAKQKEHYEANREEIRTKKKEHYEANREEILAKQKEYYEANREEILSNQRTPEYRTKKNARRRTPEYRAKKNTQRKKRRDEDLLFRVKDLLRRRVRDALKAQGAKKFTRTMDLIGCSPEFLTKRLEKQIKPGTKREDYHVDHIIPCAFFDLTKEEDQRLCFHWTNHQLLTGPVNESKSDDVFWSGQVYRPVEVPSEIREEIYAHCRSNMTLRSS